ncbi:hypothetical protein Gohar_020655 [Gossypium harknessii]|uniref:Uncharacterized protein n=1 Tax=Gossypium harknessii TaxID=34285 RepID=A0A7J9HYC1_9ROSI|nr:hypothetical protein [Gossypium harknessii]
MTKMGSLLMDLLRMILI